MSASVADLTVNADVGTYQDRHEYWGNVTATFLESMAEHGPVRRVREASGFENFFRKLSKKVTLV